MRLMPGRWIHLLGGIILLAGAVLMITKHPFGPEFGLFPVLLGAIGLAGVFWFFVDLFKKRKGN
jgi:hypothetical protein